MKRFLTISLIVVSMVCHGQSNAQTNNPANRQWKSLIADAETKIETKEYQNAKKRLAEAWVLIRAKGGSGGDFDTVRKCFVKLYLKQGDRVRASNASVDGWNEIFGMQMNAVASGTATDPVDGTKSNYFLLRKDGSLEFHLGSPPHDSDVRILKQTDKGYKSYLAKLDKLEPEKIEPLIHLPQGWSYSPHKDQPTQEWLKQRHRQVKAEKKQKHE